MKVRSNNNEDKKTMSKRYHPNKADKDLQAKMENKDTPFQNDRRTAEAAGKPYFRHLGKWYAAAAKSPASVGKSKTPGPLSEMPAANPVIRAGAVAGKGSTKRKSNKVLHPAARRKMMRRRQGKKANAGY